MSRFKRTVMSVVGPHLLTSARISAIHAPTESFRFIELEAKAFMGAKLSAGDKVQINVGNWDLRTYTPISLDPETGRLGVLAYIHGQGPGSRWAANVNEGEPCQLLGPRASLKRPESPCVLFGDETAIATAASLQRLLARGTTARFIFEASDTEKVSGIVKDLGLLRAQVVPKAPGAASRSILESTNKAEQVILTGRAQSIQEVRKDLREAGFPMSRLTSKAYWSEGRVGLD